ncbi:MAG: hypothetical protein CUN57_00670, partial [Phototrophicales bacterium]
MGVYTGASVGALTEVVSNDDFGGRDDAQVTWTANSGTTYYIAVAIANATGDSSTAMREKYYITFVSTDNDDYANAVALNGDTFSVNAHNFGASKETGEDNHGGNSGGRSIWYAWTPSTSGSYRIDTFGSWKRWQYWSPATKVMDTLLGVYTGSSVDDLTLVAQNDDFDSSNKGNTTGTSVVYLDATAGTTYYIAVDGYN